MFKDVKIYWLVVSSIIAAAIFIFGVVFEYGKIFNIISFSICAILIFKTFKVQHPDKPCAAEFLLCISALGIVTWAIQVTQYYFLLSQ